MALLSTTLCGTFKKNVNIVESLSAKTASMLTAKCKMSEMLQLSCCAYFDLKQKYVAMLEKLLQNPFSEIICESAGGAI